MVIRWHGEPGSVDPWLSCEYFYINAVAFVQSRSYEINLARANPVLKMADFIKHGKTVATKTASDVLQQVACERQRLLERPTGSKGKKDDPVDDVVRMVASMVGLVSEAVQYRRQRNVRADGSPPSESSSDSPRENIEETLWAQDDLHEQAPNNEPDLAQASPGETEPKDLATAFLQRHPFKSRPETTAVQIDRPVVLPQRRPKTRARGFVRAYAPVLSVAGIDEAGFFDFIDTLNRSLEPNPYLYAINLAGLAGLAIPDPSALCIGAVVGVATAAAMEAQSRYRSGRFLDRVNSEFFMPRGVVCAVVTWSPDAVDNSLVLAHDFEGGHRPAEPAAGGLVTGVMTGKLSTNEALKRLQHDANERMKPYTGGFQCCEPAPLVFSAADEKQDAATMGVASDGTETAKKKKKNAVDRGEIWLDGFMDKRAQAKWIQESPESTVATSMPKPVFRSRYADPGHPASSGDVVAFVTGGRWCTKGKTKSKDAEGQYEKTSQLEKPKNDLAKNEADQSSTLEKEKDKTKKKQQRRMASPVSFKR